MRSKLFAGIGGLSVAAGMLVASGCSHDTLKSSTVGLTVKYTQSPSGAGRYDTAAYGVSEIRLVPADPVRRSLLSGNNFSLNAQINADLTASGTTTFSQVALSPGLYNIVGVTYTTPVLKDNVLPETPTTCIEGVSNVPSGPAAAQVPFAISLNESDGLQLNVQPGNSVIEVRADVPALISGYEAAFTCQPSCDGLGPCLTAFDQSAFRTTLLSSIAITVQ